MKRAVLIFLVFIAAAASRSVWDGAYTKEQARRGQATYLEECATCHGKDLAGAGEAPGLKGEEFFSQFGGRTAADLFEIISKTMPMEDPGSLEKEKYADIIAFVFSANEFPAGSKELDHETAPLKEIRIERKP